MVTWNYTFSWAACIPTSLPRIQNPKYLQRPFFGEFDEYLEIIASQMITHNFVLVFWVNLPRNLDSPHWKPLRLLSEHISQVASYCFLENFYNKISPWSRRRSIVGPRTDWLPQSHVCVWGVLTFWGCSYWTGLSCVPTKSREKSHTPWACLDASP